LSLFRGKLGADFLNRSKITDLLRRDRFLDALNTQYKFENLFLELRTDRPVRREAGSTRSQTQAFLRFENPTQVTAAVAPKL
jgi:hypothetical protein